MIKKHWKNMLERDTTFQMPNVNKLEKNLIGPCVSLFGLLLRWAFNPTQLSN